jgi:hypothetical protein
MKAKIDSHYSPDEIKQLLGSLVSYGLLTQSEVDSESTYFTGLQIDFFSINDLLSPFLHKFAWHGQWERKVYPWHKFYTEFTTRLIQSSPLIICRHDCYFDDEADRIIIQTGSEIESIVFETYPEYFIKLIDFVNEKISECIPGWAFYEIHVDALTTFLLLTERQYRFLLENRLIRFAKFEYPEETAWRSTLREEDFLF